MKMGEEKWIVVTGASSGIGKATAEHLIAEGYCVVVTARNKEKLEKHFGKYKDKAAIINWDLSEIDTIKEYANNVQSAIGKISGLVHCAGMYKISPVHMIKTDNVKEIFDINTFAGICLTSAFSRKSMYIENMAIVLISSINAHSGSDGNAIYASSKGAIEGFVSGSASELAAKGIRINGIVPGTVKTRMTESFFKNLSEEYMNCFENEYPLGWGEASDIAHFIEFILSDKAKWITGQNFIIDGGHLVRTSH